MERKDKEKSLLNDYELKRIVYERKKRNPDGTEKAWVTYIINVWNLHYKKVKRIK